MKKAELRKLIIETISSDKKIEVKDDAIRNVVKDDTKMIKIIQDRIKEMLKNPDIIKKMDEFKTDDSKQEYIIKAAIATLFIPVKERK